MEGFGQFYFIILLIFIFIINTIITSNKAKKAAARKKEQSVPQADAVNMEGMDDWEEWFQTEPNEKRTSGIYVDRSVTPVEAPRDYYKGTASYVPMESSFLPLEKKEKSDNSRNKSESSSPTSLAGKGIRLNSKEEARRAIIYAEIIKRKY